MTAPVPLRDPDGIVRAWMCGACFHVGQAGEYVGQNADEALVEHSRRDAARCCTCWTCGKARDPGERHRGGITCEACSARAQATIDAERAASGESPPVEMVECPGCDGSGECQQCRGTGSVAAP